MAEGTLSNVAAKILESLGKYAYQEVVSCWDARNDLEKLKGTLRFIQARIHDAETRHEEESSEAIKEWLGRLRQVLYQADDLCDYVNTLSCRQQQADRSKLDKVRKMFSSSSPLILNRKIAHEIKAIRQALDDIKSNMGGLNLRECLPHREPLSLLVVERETSSFVKADSVVGREDDKIKILDIIFDPKYAEEDVSVIPIVGFGGLGKTTLAQLIFNDERVQEHFNIVKWACVSEINNQKEVIGKTLKALSGENYHDLTMEQIQSKIREAVKGKKFLLVLDDIWDESRGRWLELYGLLQCGNPGSKIIVTTRSDVVAANVGTIPEAYKLGLLTNEESWNLFQKLAFKEGKEERNPNFAQIGKAIVENCRNVPLAIKVVGSVLYSLHTEKEWEVFRKTQFSKAKLSDHSDIMPMLKLSYDYLPLSLKPCFAYCSLFPKDYVFKSTELVQLWMAQGFVEPLEESLGMEDVGGHYFVELLRRNFFQDVEEDELTNVISFKMHDLIHDLAQRVAGDEIFILEGSSVHFTNRVVHVNVHSTEELMKDRPSLLAAKNLRSLLVYGFCTKVVLERVFLGFRSLRVLDFCSPWFIQSSSPIEVIPDSIGRMIHLRYLNFSRSNIKYLPSGITRLNNLQTLNLDFCKKLQDLPRGFTKLTNLRHLGLRDCPLTEMPRNFGRMKSLREMNRFIIGKNNGLDALTDLNLRGELEIICRTWRTNDVLEAKRANLKEKTQLTSFSLRFEYQGEETTVATRDDGQLLESLHLPISLKHLYFSGLRGNRFPRWMLKELLKLVKICIHQCETCRVLPLFSQLPLLKRLSLKDLLDVEYIEEADGVSGTSTYFPALESLKLYDMPKLKCWVKLEDKDKLQPRHNYVFPRLERLKISHCDKLTTLPSLPNLESLSVEDIQGQLLESILTSNKTTSSSLSSTPTLSRKRMTFNLGYECLIKKLVTISIENCDSCRVLPRLGRLPLLKDLTLSEMEGLECVEEADEDSGSSTFFPVLESLKLYYLPKLKSWTEREDEDKHQHSQSYVFPRLTSLEISECPKLTTFPSMPNLEFLAVLNIQEQLLESITSNQTASSSSSSAPALKYLRMRDMKLTSVKCLLKKLIISNCGSLRNMPIQCFSILEDLYIYGYEDLDSIWEDDGGEGKGEIGLNPWEGFKSLLSLTLIRMPKVELLPDWITCLTTLQNLYIEHLENLAELSQNIGNLSSLQKLSFWDCPKLTSLPQSFSALTCLQRLDIYDCPELKKRCERPDGQYWPLIQHIPMVELTNW